MKIFINILFVLSSFSTLGMDLKTNSHHIEPAVHNMNEVINEIKDTNYCAEESIKPYSYISEHPKTEVWRQYYKMPKLLTADFYKVQSVCDEAKKMNLEQGIKKDYALVANKTHFCDVGHRACLTALKSISDPCNHFIQDKFQVFHSRSFVGAVKPSGSDEVLSTYGPIGPSLLVIRLSDCQLVPTENALKIMKSKKMSVSQAVEENYFFTPPSLADAVDKNGIPLFKATDERLRFQGMKESLIKNIPELSSLKDKRVDCFIEGKRSMPSIDDMEDVQYGEIKVKGIVAIRKLLDEQLIETTGLNPYKKKK